MDGTGKRVRCLLLLLSASCLLAGEVEDYIYEDAYVNEEFSEYDLPKNETRNKRAVSYAYINSGLLVDPLFGISSTAPLLGYYSDSPSTADVSSVTTPIDTSPPSTVGASSVTSPIDTSPPSTVDASSMTSPIDPSPPSMVDVSFVTSPTDTSPPSTVDVSFVTSPTDTSPPSTVDVLSVKSPIDTSPPSTVDVSSVTSPIDTSPPSTVDVSSVTSPVDTSPSTVDALSVTSPIDTSPPSTVDVSSMTSPIDTSPPYTVDASSVTSPIDTSPPSTEDVSPMTSPIDTSPPSTEDVSSVTSPIDTSPPSTVDVSSMTSPIDTSPPSTVDISSMTSPMDTSPPYTVDISPTTTLDTATLSTISTGTPQAGPTSPVSSTSSIYSTSIGTQSTTINLSSLQQLMQQASLNKLGPAAGLSVIQSLWNYTTVSSAGFQQSEVPLILNILGNITKNAALANVTFSMDTVNKVLSITDQLISGISAGPSTSVEKNLGPQLLGTFESLLSVMSSTNESYSLSYKYLDLEVRVSSCGALEDNKSLKMNSASTISLPAGDKDYPPGCYVQLLSMTFRPQNGSFTGQYSSNGNIAYYLASDIQTNVMNLNKNIIHTANLNMAFTCGNRSCDSTALCVYWDFSLNAWSSSGCLTQVTHGVTNCVCNHLTSFSILMSGSLPEDTMNSYILDNITEVGLAISIASLLICISIQVILLMQTNKTAAVYRHVTNLHMSVFLLVSNFSFLSSSFIDPSVQEKLCVTFTFLTHFSLLAFFCWTWVQGLYLVCRLIFVFHHVTKTEFLAFSIVLGYLCPLAIVVGTFLAYFPNNYMNDKACWLNRRSGAYLSFNIPTIIIMCGNVLVLVIVIRKLLRPSISEGHSEDEEVVKKLAKALLFCIPQFGLTWAIGIPLFANPNSIALNYMFDILNPLQGFFLLLFGCLLDKKVMDLVKKRVTKNSSTSSMATTVSSA